MNINVSITSSRGRLQTIHRKIQNSELNISAGSFFETRPGPRNITGFLGRAKEDLNNIRMLELPGLGPSEVYSRTKRNEIKEFLQTKDEFFHAFIWVKNASHPRYTRADEETFQLIEELYGPGWMNNMLIILAGFNFSAEARAELPRWDGFKQQVFIEHSMGITAHEN